MSMFVPKKGPVFTGGRVKHALFGAVVPIMLGLLSRYVLNGSYYDGATAGAVVVVVGGGIWESATSRIASVAKWSHPWGDLIDFLSFVAGAIITVLPVGLLGTK